MTRHYLYWLGLIVALNLLSVSVYLFFNQSMPLDFAALAITFTLGFFLQWPVFLCVSLVHLLMVWPLRSTRNPDVPLNRWRAVLIILLSYCPIFLFIFVYSISQLLFAIFNVFASYEIIETWFVDGRQILPTLIYQHPVGFSCAIVIAFLLSFSYYHVVIKRSSSLQPWPKKLAGHFFALVGFVVSLWLINDSKALPAKIRDDICGRTFPTVFALPFLRMEDGVEACKGKPFNHRAELKPVISLKEYSARQPPLGQKPPIFIIMLESITAEHIAFNGYTRKELTPNIDRLLSESISFTRAYAPANHSNYAQTSFSSSQYARRRCYLDFFDRVDYPKVLLSDILAHYGYQTAFISSQNEDWQGMREFTLHESRFDHYYHSKNALGGNIDIERKIDDSEVVDEAMRTLERFDKARPSYLYLNMQRTHYPYTLCESAERPYQPSELTSSDTYFHYPKEHISSIVNRYDNAIHYVDKQVGVFIDYLKAKDLYDQAIIVIASDHGEGFYAQGYPTHGTSMFDDQIRSFAAFKVPYGKKVEIRRDAISLIDINPSILELLNLRNHPSFQGRQIIKTHGDGRCLFSTGQGVIQVDCVIQYPWKFVSSQRDGKRLIHLEWDKKEARDYSSDYPDKRRELEDALLHHIEKQLFYYNDLPAEERKKYYPPQF